MAKEQELEEMEQVEGTEKTRKPWTPKPLTEEEIATAKEGIAIIREQLGVSETMDKVLNAVIDWRNEDKDAQAANRKTLADSIGENIRDIMNSDEFKAELAKLKGLGLVAQLAGQIASYYGRKTYVPKPKTKNITINGQLYSVNAEFLETIKNEADPNKRREMLLNHPDTKKKEDIEEF